MGVSFFFFFFRIILIRFNYVNVHIVCASLIKIARFQVSLLKYMHIRFARIQLTLARTSTLFDDIIALVIIQYGIVCFLWHVSQLLNSISFEHTVHGKRQPSIIHFQMY